MSEAIPHFDPAAGPERPDLSCVPENSVDFTVKFAAHARPELKDTLWSMLTTEIEIELPAKKDQKSETVRITPFDELKQTLKISRTPDWDIVTFSATQAGMIPQGESQSQQLLREAIYKRIENAYKVYHQSYCLPSGITDVDKVIELVELTEDYDDAPLITIINTLKQRHITGQPEEHFKDAERIVRILILEEILK